MFAMSERRCKHLGLLRVPWRRLVVTCALRVLVVICIWRKQCPTPKDLLLCRVILLRPTLTVDRQNKRHVGSLAGSQSVWS